MADALSRLTRLDDVDPFEDDSIIVPGQVYCLQYCLTTDIDYPLSMAKISDEQKKLEDLRKILENGSDDPD